MISPKIAKLIEYLPNSIVTFFTNKVVDYLIKKYVSFKIEGLEKLKDINKPVIFISNHLSNSDALILNKFLKEQDVTFVAGIKLTENATTNLGIKLVKTTVLKPNNADKEGLTKIINIVKGGNNILIFPEGTRSRNSQMIEGKKGLLLIAKITGAPIVPIGIYGTEKFLPINESGDMAGESFHHAEIGVKIGNQIELPHREKNEDKAAYEKKTLTFLMKSIAVLIPEEYRGVYK